MKKSHLDLIFNFLILALTILFLFSGLNYEKTVTETMVWTSLLFKITTESKLIGISLILSVPIYIIILKKYERK